MGEVIGVSAEISRVEEHIRDASRNALARGDEIADAAKSRLGPAVVAIDAALAARKAADEAEADAWAKVLVVDAEADVGIGSTRDEMWNALGRPKQSPALDEVFPEGISTYTSGDPRNQPVLMQVLHSRIVNAAAPQWSKDKRTEWAARIEALRAPYHAAVEAHRPLEATALVAEAGYRAAVRAGHARLRSFKRDLKSLGLTETQIHEIIPDATARKSARGEEPK